MEKLTNTKILAIVIFRLCENTVGKEQITKRKDKRKGCVALFIMFTFLRAKLQKTTVEMAQNADI